MRDNPRLYVNAQLFKDEIITLSKEQAHYLVNVMRCGINDYITVFNGKDGEWNCEITSSSKKSCDIAPRNQIRPSEELPDFTLLFAPIKGHRNDNIIEKATELGIANIQPILTERTIVRKINAEKYLLTAIEAAEQCERVNIPLIKDISPLEVAIEEYDGKILFADEYGGGKKIGECFAQPAEKIALLVGPEGGFSQKEHDFTISQSNVIPISLGKRILRADTAAIAGLTLLQTYYGDF